MPPVAGEDAPLEPLLEEANRGAPGSAVPGRPGARRSSSRFRSIEGQYGPALSATLGFRQGGTALDRLGWNGSRGSSLSWNIFQGGLTRAQVSEAQANVMATVAQLDLLRQQIQSDVDGARLALRAAKESLSSTQERW